MPLHSYFIILIIIAIYPGWFDHWFEEKHNVLLEADFR